MPRLFSGKVILYLLTLHTLDLCFMPFWGTFRPVLVYLWVLYAAFYAPAQVLIPAAVMAGLLRDLTGSQPLGSEAISLSVMACALNFLILKFQHEFMIFRMVMGGGFIFFSLLLTMIIGEFLSPQTVITWHAVTASFCAALISAALMPFFFHLTRRWFPPETGGAFLKQYELFH